MKIWLAWHVDADLAMVEEIKAFYIESDARTWLETITGYPLSPSCDTIKQVDVEGESN